MNNYVYNGGETRLLETWNGEKVAGSHYADLCGWIEDKDEAVEIIKSFNSGGKAKVIVCLSVHTHEDSLWMPFIKKTQDVKEFKRYIDDLGFSIPQGHLIFMNQGDITSRDNTYAIENLKRNLDFFNELDVKSAVLHYSNYGTEWDPVEQWFDIRVDALNQLTDYIKGTEMAICLENLCRVWDYDAGHLLKMCKAVDNQKNIGICLDTGHLNISNFGNQYDFIMQAGDYLKAMHVHYNKGEHDGMIGLPCDSHMMLFKAEMLSGKM